MPLATMARGPATIRVPPCPVLEPCAQSGRIPGAPRPYPGHLAGMGRFNRYFHFCIYRLSLGFELLCFIN